MKNRNKVYVFSIALLVTTLILFVPVQPAKARFVISAYTFSPDNYGNAIAYIGAYYDDEHNGTMYYDPDAYPTSTGINPIETYVGINISLSVACWLNATYAGVSTIEEGRNVIRHNVSVAVANGTVIFSQQNFTYWVSTDGYAPMYFYVYLIDLDFEPLSGQTYYVTIFYEVYGM